MDNEKKDSRTALQALTSCRFLAAFAVVLYHYGESITRLGPSWLESVREQGHVGVGFFFVLSGFILTYKYLKPLEEKTIRPFGFYLLRLARIYPLHLVAMLAMLPFLSLTTTKEVLLPSMIAQLTLTQSWFRQFIYTWNTPAWTISHEFFFYLVFPFALLLLRRVNFNVISLLLLVLLIRMQFPLPMFFYPSLPLIPLLYSPLGRLAEFLLGMLLGRYFLFKQRVPPRGVPDILVLCGLIGIYAASCLASDLPSKHTSLFSLPFSLIIIGLASGGLISKVLRFPPLLFLGEISYAIYLMQVPVKFWLKRLLGQSPSSAMEGDFFLYVIALFLVSSLTLFCIERPIRSLARNFVYRL